ncbi:MAG: NRDE family protein [Nevskiales bacterium]
MCLIALAWRADARYPLVVAANRDEFHLRKTAAAESWPEHQEILAGRDLKEGGTWMGVSTKGRFAAVTNRRSLSELRPGAPSRGHLVGDFLKRADPPADYLNSLAPRAMSYSGFNLLVMADDTLGYFGNAPELPPRTLAPGLYALSNGTLDSDWPKMKRVRERLNELVSANLPESTLVAELFVMLADRSPAEDDSLPDTGMGRMMERMLSAPFICSPGYGTRSSTVLLVDANGGGRLLERRFKPSGKPSGETELSFVWPN